MLRCNDVSDLATAQASELQYLLNSYRAVFDLDNRPLGRAIPVKHGINTGDTTSFTEARAECATVNMK